MKKQKKVLITTMINKEMIIQARQSDLAVYLEKKGYTFTRNGNRKRCKEHDSLVITNNMYYWNSKNTKGNSLDFLINELGLDFKVAVKDLSNQNLEIKNSPQASTPKKSYIVTKDYLNRAYAYLNKKRYIDYSIISNMIEKGYLKMITGEQYKYPVIGFTIFDEAKNIVGYELQGTFDKIRFKGITSDTKYGYGFNIQIGQPDRGYFFESALDMLSFYNIYRSDLKDCFLASMAGLKVNVLTYMQNSLKTKIELYICVDNDKAGNNFKDELKKQNIEFKEVNIPDKTSKDWNEYLIKSKDKKTNGL